MTYILNVKNVVFDALIRELQAAKKTLLLFCIQALQLFDRLVDDHEERRRELYLCLTKHIFAKSRGNITFFEIRLISYFHQGTDHKASDLQEAVLCVQ